MTIRNVEIASKLSDITTLIQDAKSWAAVQPGTSLDAHLATYVDVCLLGVLEESIEILFRERADRPGDQCTANYIRHDLAQSFQNPKFGRIRDVLYKFNPLFGSTFEARMPANSPEMQALKDINTIKQNIAHEGVYNLRLTLADVEDYFNRVTPVLEALEAILT